MLKGQKKTLTALDRSYKRDQSTKILYYFFLVYYHDLHLLLLQGYQVIVAEDLGDKILWQEDNKEFSIDGVLYDVARIKKSEGKTFLYCLNDKQEKQLLDGLTKAVNANHGNKQEKNSIKSLLADLVCMNDEEQSTIFSVPSSYSLFNVTLVSSFEEINILPPKA